MSSTFSTLFKEFFIESKASSNAVSTVFPDEKANEDCFLTEDEKKREDADYGVLLTKSGIKKVIAAFEDKIDTLIFYTPLEKKISYLRIIYEQAEHYRRVIVGEENEYRSYYFK